MFYMDEVRKHFSILIEEVVFGIYFLLSYLVSISAILDFKSSIL